MKALFVLILVMFSFVCAAQVSSTHAQTVSINTDLPLHIGNLGSDVKIVNIKGNRIIVETTLTVKHSKAESVHTALKSSALLTVTTVSDNDSITLTVKEQKVVITSGETADVTITRTLYVPAHVKIFQ